MPNNETEQPAGTTEYVRKTVHSVDGTPITYRQLGKGPQLVLVPGSMGSAQDYMVMARALSDTYTVSIINRRGHGEGSGPIQAGHNMETECRDLTAVLEDTQARLLFGHSIGGLISLKTALAVPLSKLAVYEPPLSIDGSISTSCLPDLEQAITQKEYARGMAIIMKGLELSSDASKLPLKALTLLITVMMRLRKTEDGQRWGDHIIELLPSMPHDIRLLREMDSTQADFRQLTTPTLLIYGSKTARHFASAVQSLSNEIPGSKVTVMPGLEHNAPNQDAPLKIAQEVRHFFA